jgi:serine/threonine-protein kinase
MGPGTMMAGATSQIPPVEDYGYAGQDYRRGRRGDGGSGRRWIPWLLGLLLVAGVVIGVAYYLLAGGKTYAVPLVNNEPVATAQAQIKAAHLQVHVVDQANGSVKQGYVISSSPAEGNNVAANTLVTLYVSTGAAPVAVPNVEGKQQAAAETTLQNDGFAVSVQQDTTSTQPQGTVVNQSPVGGTMVAPGSKVTIFVSGAAAVPNVVGLSGPSAQTSLQSAGFKVTMETVAGPAGTTPGNVWQQNPAANATAAPGTSVTILVQPAASPSPSASSTPTSSPSPSPTGSSTLGLGF